MKYEVLTNVRYRFLHDVEEHVAHLFLPQSFAYDSTKNLATAMCGIRLEATSITRARHPHELMCSVCYELMQEIGLQTEPRFL